MNRKIIPNILNASLLSVSWKNSSKNSIYKIRIKTQKCSYLNKGTGKSTTVATSRTKTDQVRIRRWIPMVIGTMVEIIRLIEKVDIKK